jgi:hypothetical protein
MTLTFQTGKTASDFARNEKTKKFIEANTFKL